MSFRTNPLENNPARKENSMKKIAVDQLCVEVTRRCNMSCMPYLCHTYEIEVNRL